MAKKGQRVAAPPRPPHADDFTTIKGIGPGIARRLNEARIRTFAKLAALSPAGIAASLRGVAGLSAGRIAKQDWIGQARKLAATHKPPLTKATDKPAFLRRPQHYASFTIRLTLDEKNNVLRTIVVHSRDKGQATWPGWEQERLIDFFIEKAELRLPATRRLARAARQHPPATRPQAPEATFPIAADEPTFPSEPEVALPLPAVAPTLPPEPETKLQLDVGEITVSEFPPDRTAGKPPLRKRLHTEINFRLSGTPAEQMVASQSHYFIQLLADGLATRQTTVLATSQGQLQPQLLYYTVAVEFPLPDLGSYQLVGVVTFPEQVLMGVSPRSVLNVVP